MALTNPIESAIEQVRNGSIELSVGLGWQLSRHLDRQAAVDSLENRFRNSQRAVGPLVFLLRPLENHDARFAHKQSAHGVPAQVQSFRNLFHGVVSFHRYCIHLHHPLPVRSPGHGIRLLNLGCIFRRSCSTSPLQQQAIELCHCLRL